MHDDDVRRNSTKQPYSCSRTLDCERYYETQIITLFVVFNNTNLNSPSYTLCVNNNRSLIVFCFWVKWDREPIIMQHNHILSATATAKSAHNRMLDSTHGSYIFGFVQRLVFIMWPTCRLSVHVHIGRYGKRRAHWKS